MQFGTGIRAGAASPPVAPLRPNAALASTGVLAPSGRASLDPPFRPAGASGGGIDYDRLAEAIAARGPGMVVNMPISAAVATGDLPTEIPRRLRSIEHLWG
jgi:hypothetical protein